jgi:hypothetical protein
MRFPAKLRPLSVTVVANERHYMGVHDMLCCNMLVCGLRGTRAVQTAGMTADAGYLLGSRACKDLPALTARSAFCKYGGVESSRDD